MLLEVSTGQLGGGDAEARRAGGEGVSHGPVWEVTGPGAASSGDRGPHVGAGLKNSKKGSVAVCGEVLGAHVGDLMPGQVCQGLAYP